MASVEPPSRHEALKAKITIKKYIETIDEPHARKMESILADFAHSNRHCLQIILHANSRYYY